MGHIAPWPLIGDGPAIADEGSLAADPSSGIAARHDAGARCSC